MSSQRLVRARCASRAAECSRSAAPASSASACRSCCAPPPGPPRCRAADACILLFLNGGPSHLDMWDMKPDAPAEIRGEFKPIATSLPGVQLSRAPAEAGEADAPLRPGALGPSQRQQRPRGGGLLRADRPRPRRDRRRHPADRPPRHRLRRRPDAGRRRRRSCPTSRCRTSPPRAPAGRRSRASSAACSAGRAIRCSCCAIPTRRTSPCRSCRLGPDVPPDRLDARGACWTASPSRRRRRPSPGDERLPGAGLRPAHLAGHAEGVRAASASRSAVRDAYGRNIYGQSVLLARRLIEAGTRVACISWAPDANATWDTHGNNFAKLKNELLPQLDAAPRQPAQRT